MKHYSRRRKKNSTKIFITITALVAIVFGSYAYYIEQDNQIVAAKVNNEKIFKSDIEKKLKDVFSSQNQDIQTPNIENLPKEVIEILAREIYLEKELTKKAQKSKIAKAKETKDKLREVKSHILRQFYIDSLLKEEISEENISNKYAELVNELSEKNEFHVFHIVSKDEKSSQKIAKELKSRGSSKFSSLAKKHSIDKGSAQNGGDLGYILEDNLIKEIAKGIEGLKNNQISAPIQSKFGWHLVKITDERKVNIPAFESVKDNIRDQLIQNKINEINSAIIKDAKVEVLLELKKQESQENPQESLSGNEDEGENKIDEEKSK